jgi:hypothetical protein
MITAGPLLQGIEMIEKREKPKHVKKTCRYEMLWEGVLEQALRDARKDQHSARDWFFHPAFAEDRELVADFAGEDIKWWQRKALHVIKEREHG